MSPELHNLIDLADDLTTFSCGNVKHVVDDVRHSAQDGQLDDGVSCAPPSSPNRIGIRRDGQKGVRPARMREWHGTTAVHRAKLDSVSVIGD